MSPPNPAIPMPQLQIARRPNAGTKGVVTKVRVNMFPVTSLPAGIIHHYTVTMQPSQPSSAKARVVLSYIEEILRGFEGIEVAYDGQANIFAPSKLPFPNDIKEFIFTLPDEYRDRDDFRAPYKGPRPQGLIAPPAPTGGVGQTRGKGKGKGTTEPKVKEDTTRRRAGRDYTVTITKKAQINPEELKSVLSGRTKTMDGGSTSVILALNVMLRHKPTLLYPNKKSSLYPFPTGVNKMLIRGSGLELWRGFYSSLRPGTGKLLLNIDVTAAPFVLDGDMVKVVSHIVRDPHKITDYERIRLARLLTGVKVRVEMRKGVPGLTPRITYRIKSLSRKSANDYTFQNEEGKTISIKDYFKRTYNVDLKFPNLPVVQVSARAYYPLELLHVEVGNKFVKKLNPDEVADMIKFTQAKPVDRLAGIAQGLAFINYGQNPTCTGWGFKHSFEPMQVQARILPAPGIVVSDLTHRPKNVSARDGKFDMRGVRFLTSASQVKALGVLVFDKEPASNRSTGSQSGGGGANTGGARGRAPRPYPRDSIRDHVNSLIKACKDKGMSFASACDKPSILYCGESPTNVLKQFELIKTETVRDHKTTPDMIIVWLPKGNTAYAQVKLVGDVAIGIPTQCLNMDKTFSAKYAYWSNVAQKINIKLSGVNHNVSNFPGIPRGGRTLILGADVTHPAPGSLSPSIASVVGTFDRELTQYKVAIGVQEARSEIIDSLGEKVVSLLDYHQLKYDPKERKRADRIIMFRDGVSEGQFADVMAREVAAIKQACAGDYRPKITYIICGKRHHVRMVPDAADADRETGNVKAGTVIDREITHPTEWDYYLVSHQGLLGTSRPTHYSVLFDENGFNNDDLQQLTYNLAYTYARSTRSVSIVTPAYYAHHACTRAEAHLSAVIGNSRDDASVTATSADSAEAQRQRVAKLAEARGHLKDLTANEKLQSALYFL